MTTERARSMAGRQAEHQGTIWLPAGLADSVMIASADRQSVECPHVPISLPQRQMKFPSSLTPVTTSEQSSGVVYS